MKLVVMHYLRSLRERDELDAILPDLLAESGFEVLTRPRRGTRQAGVDVAAVGPNPDRGGARSLFLFTIKSGDLTREHWDTGQQAVRPSLNEILDDYIPNRIPPHFANLPVVICVCMGGEMREDIRAQWSGFCQRNEKENVHFAEWNGDRLADLILSGMLRAELIESENRARRHYPTPTTEYRDVLSHPRNRSDGYFEEHTRAGILYTFVLAWLAMIGDQERAEQLRSTLLEYVPHMTHQIWIPDARTDEVFWDGDRDHGVSVPGLPLNDSLEDVFSLLNRVMKEYPLDERISAVRNHLTPIFLMACRHYRMPVPPHVWRGLKRSSPDSTVSDQGAPDAEMQQLQSG